MFNRCSKSWQTVYITETFSRDADEMERNRTSWCLSLLTLKSLHFSEEQSVSNAETDDSDPVEPAPEKERPSVL